MSMGDTYETGPAPGRALTDARVWKAPFLGLESAPDQRKISRLRIDRFVAGKLKEASMSENWAVVSFWVKLWTFSWLLAVQLLGVMVSRLVKRLNPIR